MSSIPEGRAALALSTVALVPAFYGAVLPSMTDVRSSDDRTGHYAAGERYAALVTGATVLGVAAVTGSPEVAVAGLIAVVAFSAAYHNAHRADPRGREAY